MDRRSFLRLTSIGGAGFVTGCLQTSVECDPDETGSDANEPVIPIDSVDISVTEWNHPIGGRVDAIVDGLLFGRESWEHEAAKGGVFSIDAETGDHKWSVGETGGYHSFTPLSISDRVYFGKGNDAIGDGTGRLFALEFDGSEWWTLDIGSVYAQPFIRGGVLYVGSDDGVVRSIDIEDGDILWEIEINTEYPDVRVSAIHDSLFVVADQLLTLDPADGGERWRHGNNVRSAIVHDGIAYTSDSNGISAVCGGEEKWRVRFDTNKWLYGVESDRLLVRQGWDLRAFDVDSGDEVWMASDIEGLRVETADGRVYAAGDRLFAISAKDGEIIWDRPVPEGDRFQSVAIVDGDSDDYKIITHFNDSEIEILEKEGRVIWSDSVTGRINNFLLDQAVFVGTSEGIFSLVV